MAGVTVVEDLDAENLLEHLCLEEEAKEVRGWVAAVSYTHLRAHETV